MPAPISPTRRSWPLWTAFVLFVAAVACVPIIGRQLVLSAGFVLDWNALVLDMQRVRAQGNPPAARALAILDAAIYDSVNAVSPTHTAFHVDARTFPGAGTASADAAAAQAAHDVAYALYSQPRRSRLC